MAMAGLKDRMKREVREKPTEKAILQISGQKPSKSKYPVNVVFDGSDEARIRTRAKEMGLGVATYIKMLVAKDLNQN